MKSVALAFSGGLDTSYCALWLREQGFAVHTVTVNTGGFDADELKAIESRARELRVADHATIDGREPLFNGCLRYLLFGNSLRGGVYPMCVSAERIVQAQLVAQHALKIAASALAHGSTGAGNDQFRFDAGFRIFATDLPIIAPIRQQALTRAATTAYLEQHGVKVPPKTTAYSINRGLWGTTIGGAETHRSDGVLPESAWVTTAGPERWPKSPQEIAIRFERGIPVAIDARNLAPVELIERISEAAGAHGVGRGVHVGDTILGIKGRVAFEAPGPLTLIAAHRELEKLVLSRQQLFWKSTLGDLYGAAVHEARFFDPLMRDLEAFLASSQQRVTGEVRVRLFSGQATVLGATSPHSLMDAKAALYGEQSALWTGEEAAAFAKLYGLQDMLLSRIGDKSRK